MELNVRNESKIVEIWLTKAEKQDAKLQRDLEVLYQCFKESFHEVGYTVATFLSGDQDLADITSDLVCYNRKRIAQLEVEREKKQGLAMSM